MTARRPILASLVLVTAGTLLAAGCGGSSSGSQSSGSPSSTASSGSASAKLHAMLPASIRSSGQLRLGIEAAFPPMEYKEPSGQLTGFDVDFANAIAAKLGVHIAYQDQPFDQLVNSLATSRVDLIVSAISDTPARRQRFSFIDYFNSGAQAYTSKAQSSSVTSLNALCGKNVSFNAGTDYIQTFQAWSKAHCGSNPLHVATYDNNQQSMLQVTEGRSVAGVMGPDELGWVFKRQPGQFVTVGSVLNPEPYGIAVRKSDPQLLHALLAAAKQVVADGQYTKLLAEWHVQSGGVKQLAVNGSPA
jgi:polar amino acid transport system substrate-binding protein